jgi:hypothetical protein
VNEYHPPKVGETLYRLRHFRNHMGETELKVS